MAQDVKIRNVVYENVPSVEIPYAEGAGNAKFFDISESTLSTSGELLNGVKAFKADGTPVTGNIPERDGSDLSASGATVTVPAGNYATQATKSVASGSVTAPSTISGTSASVSTGSNTLTLTKTVSVTPNVTTAGYVSSGTAGNASVSLTASVPTKASETIAPSTSNQTIASGTYLTGTQTIAGVTTTNLVASNIVAGVTVKVGYSGDDDCVASVLGSAQVPSISQDSVTKILSIS